MDRKLKEREKARTLRIDGKSLREISEILNVTKGSVSIWVRDIPQPEIHTVAYKRLKKEEREERLRLLREDRKKEKFPSDEKIAEHIENIKAGLEATLKNRLLSGDSRWMVPAPTYYKGKKYIKNRYVYEHRLIMEEYLGRLLESEELVHHINGDKLDNRLKNLEIVSRSKHSYMHAKDPIYVTLTCDYCGAFFERCKNDTHNEYKHNFCSLSHSVKFQMREKYQSEIIKHGTQSGYRHGCKCDICKIFHNNKQKEYRRSKVINRSIGA